MLAHSLHVLSPRLERCAAKWRGFSVLAAVVREKACLLALRLSKVQESKDKIARSSRAITAELRKG